MTKIGHQRQPNWKYFQQEDDNARSMAHKQSNQKRPKKSFFLPIILINHTDKIGSFTFFNRIQLCVPRFRLKRVYQIFYMSHEDLHNKSGSLNRKKAFMFLVLS